MGRLSNAILFYSEFDFLRIITATNVIIDFMLYLHIKNSRQNRENADNCACAVGLLT